MSLEHTLETWINEWRAPRDGSLAKVLAGLIERRYYLVPLADLPEVTEQRDGMLSVGTIGVHSNINFEHAMEYALERLAVALHLQSRESEAAVLEARRDELARELLGTDALYEHISEPFRRTIDRLAAAEDEVAKLRGESK